MYPILSREVILINAGELQSFKWKMWEEQQKK